MNTIIHKGELRIIKDEWYIPSYHKLPDSVKRQLIRKDLYEYNLQEKKDDIFFNNLRERYEEKHK